MMPKPSTSGTTHANVTIARSLRSNLKQLASTHPLRKCVIGLTKSGALDLDQHVAVLDLDRIYSDLHIWVVRRCPGLRIPRPRVPGADQLAILDHALSKRTSAMQADVIHRRVFAIHVSDADFFVTAAKFFRFIG